MREEEPRRGRAARRFVPGLRAKGDDDRVPVAAGLGLQAPGMPHLVATVLGVVRFALGPAGVFGPI